MGDSPGGRQAAEIGVLVHKAMVAIERDNFASSMCYLVEPDTGRCHTARRTAP